MINRALQVKGENITEPPCGKNLNWIPIYTIHKDGLQMDQSPKGGSYTNRRKCENILVALAYGKTS